MPYIKGKPHEAPLCLRDMPEPISLATLTDKREAILEIVRSHRGVDLHVFGSVARGDNTPINDIDFIVTMEHGASLFDQIRLQQHLTQYLGCSIDLLNMDGLTQAFDGKGDYRRQKILAEKIPL